MRTLRRLAIALLFTFLIAPAASAVTFNWDFVGGGLDGNDSTITFAAVGDPEPTSFLIDAGIINYTEATPVSAPFNFTWASGVPSTHDSTTILDAFVPMALSKPTPAPGDWSTSGFAIASGTYTFAAIPEPSTALLLGLGLIGLATRQRRLGS